MAKLKGWFLLLSSVIALAAFAQPPANRPSPNIPELFSLARQTISGEQAYQTTAFVEQYFRIAGNSGFNKSIYHVTALLERAGYVAEEDATTADRLTYRVERRPMEKKTWEPVNASLHLEGDTAAVLSFSSNRNMIAINSFSTPPEGVTAEVIYIRNLEEVATTEVKGKIVFSDAVAVTPLFEKAIQQKGAAGMLIYKMPSYTRPEQNINSIQFGSIPQDEKARSFGLFLSYRAKEELKKALENGKTKVLVRVETRLYESEELTIVAEIKGSQKPGERFVFSAHVQEPGANDNASGVGCLAEIATAAAELVQKQQVDSERTLTFLWGDEIISTRRYIQEDPERAEGILWGLSLDMVGEDTRKTGGSFLIEKMPDPSAIWTRGNDKHSEWGGDLLEESDMFPHFFNDFVINRFEEQGRYAGWEVNTNPFEGGSDHTPFLDAKIPGVLAWHFTDMYYHTDGDRLENVSKETLRNVGTGALVIALTLCTANQDTALEIAREIEAAAKQRLNTELELSLEAVKAGNGTIAEQQRIIETWGAWYEQALISTLEIPVEAPTKELKKAVKSGEKTIKKQVNSILNQMDAI